MNSMVLIMMTAYMINLSGFFNNEYFLFFFNNCSSYYIRHTHTSLLVALKKMCLFVD